MSGALQPGHLLSRYLLLEEIGVGGMGVVYRAQDQRLQREIALKVLPPTLVEDPERRARLIREAKIVANLSHPNIAAVYDAGEVDGAVFIAMELIEGESLRSFIRRRPVGIATVLSLATEIADALSTAHARGVIHRDLKPDNVMVRRDLHAKLLDFGLAKLRERPTASDQETTRPPATVRATTDPDRIMGTPAYMSPEQARAEPLDPRTDIFSFGVLLFEMLAGDVPFRGNSHADTISAIIRDDPPPIRRRNPGVPRALERLLLRCLEKDRAARFPDAGELLAELRAVQVGPGLGAPVRIESIAILPLREEGADPFPGDGVIALLRDRLSSGSALRVAGGDSVLRLQGESPSEVMRRLGVHAVLSGSVSHRNQRICLDLRLLSSSEGDRPAWAGEYERRVEDLPALVDEIARALNCEAGDARAGMPPLDARRAPGRAAVEAFLRGVHLWNRRSAAAWGEAIACLRQATEEAPGFTAAHVALARACATLATRGGIAGREARWHARVHARKAVDLDAGSPAARAVLGSTLLFLAWDIAAAEEELRRALESDAGSVEARIDHAWALAAQGATGKSVDGMRQGVENDPLSPRCWVSLALALRFDRNPVEMLRVCDEGLERIGDERSLILARAEALLLAGRAGEAAQALEEAGGRPPLASWLAARAAAQTADGRPSEARRTLGRLEEMSWSRPVSPLRFARVHAALGEAGAAVDLLRQARDERCEELVFAQVDPSWDTLRGESAFQDLCHSVLRGGDREGRCPTGDA